jgi:membrane-bound lytic murein transglycosylase B
MRFRALGFLQVFLVLFCFAITPDFGWSAGSNDPHAAFFEDVRARLLKEGFNQTMLARLYGKPDVRFDAETVSLFFVHSEARVNYKQFTTWKAIRKARHYIEAHEKELQYAKAEYKVDPEVITAIMLVETQLGTYMGRSQVFNVLSTMAALNDSQARNILYKELPPKRRYSRAKFEKKAAWRTKWAFKELVAFIHYTAREDLDTIGIKGSYAGAIGIAQFMPTNAYKMAKDGNGDGRKDLFEHADAIASIAYYLKYHGWKPGISSKKQHRVILHYNNSTVYANTVLEIANKLK